MNVLVTGACGQLGCALREISRGHDLNFVFTDVIAAENVAALDATDQAAVDAMVSGRNIDVIVNCAGYTDVAGAEDNEDKARLLNAVLPGVLAAAAKKADATLIHISTDYVFDGKSSVPYKENDAPAPLGVYARTKMEGEEAVRNAGCRHIILRTAWLYSIYGKNFFKTIEDKASTLPVVKVVFDQVGTPTYAPDLAHAIIYIMEEGLLDREGTYHYTNEGVCSWYDFAKSISRRFGYLCDVQPCSTADFPSKVQRPSFSVLDKSLFRKTFGLEIPHWEDSLEFAVSEYQLKSNK